MSILFNSCIFTSPIPTARSHRIQTRASLNSPVSHITNSLRSCECYDMYKQKVLFRQAKFWQESIVKHRRTLIDNNEDVSDTLFVLQHYPVFSLGTNSSPENLLFDIKKPPLPVHETERAGEVTYHGPGQLVMYTIMNLRYQEKKMDTRWFLRALEEVVIRVLSSRFNIKASQVPGLTGVWVGDKKLAAIGIHNTSKWVTYNGLALNVSTDLSPYEHIHNCGLRDRGVGSIKEVLNESFSTCDDDKLIDIAHDSLLKEFSEVFQVELSRQPITKLRNVLKKK